MKKIKLATVFSGIGAIEQAFLKNGIEHEIIFACDNGERILTQSYEEIIDDFNKQKELDINAFIEKKYDETGKINFVKKSYLANYKPQKWYEDIRFLDGTKYMGQVDILVGGSPCQSFSIIGKRAGLDDTRGTLFYDFARLVKEIGPKVFIFENVPGMLNHDNGKTWKTIKEVFESLNYTINFKLLNAIDYGIPQKRTRLFLVGFKDPFYKFNFPEKQILNTTMFDYLEKNVDSKHYLGEKGFKFVTDTGKKIRNRAQVNQSITRTQIANQQFNWIGDFVFEPLDPLKHTNEILERAYIGEFHGKEGVIRQLSHREVLRLMGFSDSFKIVVPNVQIYRQSGNSIVVNVLSAILNSIIETRVFEEENKIRVGTLFSGIGSFEFALKTMNIPHDVVFAVDNGNRQIEYDQEEELKKIKGMVSIEEKIEYSNNLYNIKTKKKNYVQQSYQANYKIKNDRFFQDIKLFDGEDFKGKVDILVGGSPCQTFSTVGFQKGLEDTRGTLFYEYARIVMETQPKIFIYENVRGLITHDKGNTFEIVKGVFDSLGYKYYISVLNSKDYGLPQNRRRLFIIGFKDHDINFSFPLSIPLKHSMQDLLLEQCKEGDFKYKEEKFTFGDKGENVDDKYFLSEKLYKYVMCGGTKTFYQKPEIDLKIARTILSTMGNRHRAGIDNYVTVDGKVRMLTEREALRLMGFDDDYKIVVSRAQSYKQAGNSIAVPVLMHLIRSILSTKAV